MIHHVHIAIRFLKTSIILLSMYSALSCIVAKHDCDNKENISSNTLWMRTSHNDQAWSRITVTQDDSHMGCQACLTCNACWVVIKGVVERVRLRSAGVCKGFEKLVVHATQIITMMSWSLHSGCSESSCLITDSASFCNQVGALRTPSSGLFFVNYHDLCYHSCQNLQKPEVEIGSFHPPVGEGAASANFATYCESYLEYQKLVAFWGLWHRYLYCSTIFVPRVHLHAETVEKETLAKTWGNKKRNCAFSRTLCSFKVYTDCATCWTSLARLSVHCFSASKRDCY